MAFVTKKTINDETIEIIQLDGFNYAKINYQPFENIIVVCRIWFTNVDENIIKDIVIVEPSGEPKNIISEFNYLDINGEDRLNNPLKENLCRSIYYSTFQSNPKSVPYYENIGFQFNYVYVR
jgi:hypothetical protein